MHNARGKLYLVGAGPGDPELLTLKAVRALAQCDVVLYDRLIGPEILKHAPAQAELIYVGKHEGEQAATQQFIFELIEKYAKEGKTVVRLKGGDPFVFGRGAEEWKVAAAHGMDVEVVPGITSAVSLPGLAGIPLTYRRMSQSFAVITGHCRHGVEPDWKQYVRIDTLVILMGAKNRRLIAQSLIEAGRAKDEPVAFIERGTHPDEKIIESVLSKVAAGEVEVRSPAVFVIGHVVKLREQLQNSERLPR